MNVRAKSPSWKIGLFLALTILGAARGAESWVGTWATAPMPEKTEPVTPVLAGSTLRQVVHVSIGGSRVRLRLSNAFGREPLVGAGAHLALAGSDGSLRLGSDHALTFAGQASFTVPPGAVLVSDPIDFELLAQVDVAVSLQLRSVPTILTAHPGSRATSFVQVGNALSAATMTGATKVVHWYFIDALDVATNASAAAALVVLGDSITDGHGVANDQNGRWPDEFVRRFQARPGACPLGVLNLGIGGNRLLRDGTGPSALSRLDRDVFGQSGARWLLVFLGINDIGTRLNARKTGADYASAANIIGALDQIAARARDRGLRVIGGTITPYQGADFYFSPDGEADRQAVNQWIRTSGRFDAVVDFDAALRDPANPTRLAPAFDGGDHLHPSAAGYARLAEAVDPRLFDSSDTHLVIARTRAKRDAEAIRLDCRASSLRARARNDNRAAGPAALPGLDRP